MPMNPEMMMHQMMGMMEQTGVDTGMMRRCMAMMRNPVFFDSPSAVIAQAESLGLSDEQVKRLREIEKEARQKARTVLTEEQIKKMGEVPDKPMPMTEICETMYAKVMPSMEKMTEASSQGGPMMMWPMMRMMMGGQGATQGPGTKQDK